MMLQQCHTIIHISFIILDTAWIGNSFAPNVSDIAPSAINIYSDRCNWVWLVHAFEMLKKREERYVDGKLLTINAFLDDSLEVCYVNFICQRYPFFGRLITK